MKRSLCLLMALALLLPGCAGEQDVAETTEKRPGWSVEIPSETGSQFLQNEQTDEDILLEQEEEDYIESEGQSVSGQSGSSVADSSVTPSVAENSSLEQRREAVANEMRNMMSILWTPAQDITYSISGSSGGLESDLVNKPDKIVRLYAGRIYRGIPYAHGCSTADSFMNQAISTSNGVAVLDLSSEILSGTSEGTVYRRARLGNNCADAVFWAWAKVSSSITFSQTVNMTEYYGCLRVGDYEFSNPTYTGVKTKDVVAANGKDKMLECYAQMQTGDAMVRWTGSAGHAIMIMDVNVVRNETGEIDPDKSTAAILDQDSGCEKNETTEQHPTLGTIYICEQLDKTKTFASLLKSGYLPVTCQELVDPSPLKTATVSDNVSKPSVSNMFSGEIKSNYRIASVTITVKDAKGNVVQSATCYAKESEMCTFQVKRFNDSVEQAVMKGSLNIDQLPAGTYQCSYTCQISTGETFTVRQFSIQK